MDKVVSVNTFRFVCYILSNHAAPSNLVDVCNHFTHLCIINDVVHVNRHVIYVTVNRHVIYVNSHVIYVDRHVIYVNRHMVHVNSHMIHVNRQVIM